jgi:hypothetical protein
MNFPKEKEEILELARKIQDKDDWRIEEVDSIVNDMGFLKIFMGLVIHSLIAILIFLSKLLRLWRVVILLSKLRVKTDGFSYEPRQCGYNSAYTNIGLSKLKIGDVVGAIEALDESWQVYPCPHNTSFGLKTSLVKELSKYPEASENVANYVEIYKRFRA